MTQAPAREVSDRGSLTNALVACQKITEALRAVINSKFQEFREFQPLVERDEAQNSLLERRRAILRQAGQRLNESITGWKNARDALLNGAFDEAVRPYHQCHDLLTEVIATLEGLASAQSIPPEPDPAPTTPLAAVLAAVQASDTRCQERFNQLAREGVKPELAAVLNGLLPEQLERALLGNGLTGHQVKLLGLFAAYNEKEWALLLADALQRAERADRLRHPVRRRPRRSSTQRVASAAPDNH